VWTKEEIDKMHRLERELQGDKRIANKMCKHLPNKTNKQIRDKRAQPTYKRQIQEILNEDVNLDGDGEEQIRLETQEEDEVDSMEEATGRGDIDGNRLTEITSGNVTAAAATTPLILPMITVTDHSSDNPDDTSWREAFLQATIDDTMEGEFPEESEGIVNMLKQAITYAKEENGQVPIEHIDHIYSQLESYIKGSTGDLEKHKDEPGVKRIRHKNKGRRVRKRYIYARTQDMFKNNPGELAKYVRNNVNWQEQTTAQLNQEEVSSLFHDLWGKVHEIRQPFTGEPEKAIELNDIIPLISKEEVSARVARVKRDTAAGPDKILRKHISRSEIQEALRLFFSLITACGRQPSSWKKNRTTLLLKEGKDPTKAENYRPVTIGSLIGRLYWGIIDQKLRAHISSSPRQKGFVSEAGCFNDVHILNEALRIAKRKRGLVAVQLDISKAFDTVPHAAIEDALGRKGVPRFITRLIRDSYKDITTVVKQGTTEVPITLKRGVKQGDPLSPLIFNALLEPLINELEKQEGFEIDSEHQVSVLAFADDIILLAPGVPEAKRLLQTTDAYLGDLGMKISAAKCAAFQIVPTKDAWYIENPSLATNAGDQIPHANANTCIRYLGGKISPWKGLTVEGLEADFEATLQRVERLALKPHQKAQLISAHIIPNVQYQLVLAVAPTATVRRMDSTLRRVVKNIFHLPQCTANGLIYCKRRDGGLGIPKLETRITSSSLKTGIKFLDSADPVMAAIARESHLERRLQGIARAARISWPITNMKALVQYQSREKKNELKKWAALKSQGKAVKAFKDDNISNAWLINPKVFRPSRYITALRMRANVAADKAALSRAKMRDDIKCRKCRVQNETLGHIIGQCASTKKERIERHDQIKDFILKRIVENDKEAAVTREPTLLSPEGGILKPDLVVKNQEGVFVVDITVRHEDGGNLQMGRRSKIEKYAQLLPDLLERFEMTTGEVLPVVVGTRGALPKQTVEVLDKLRIKGRKDLLTISLMSFRGSIALYTNFMDYNAPIEGE
jgi:hypothetical protein